MVERFNQQQRDTAYRICVTDALRLISENTAMQVAGGKYFTMRYADIIKPKRNETEGRSADDVINKIRDGLRRISK